LFFQDAGSDSTSRFKVSKCFHLIDLVIGAAMKLLEMVRGCGWDNEEQGGGDKGRRTVRKTQQSLDKALSGVQGNLFFLASGQTIPPTIAEGK